MKINKKPVDTVVKQLQSKRYHVKTQDNKKAYNRGNVKKELKAVLNDSVGKDTNNVKFLAD